MEVMRRALPTASLAALMLFAALPLAGCGSATKTVTAANSPPATTASSISSTPTAPPATTSTSPTPPATTSIGSTTRTSTEPAFTEAEGEARTGSLAAAVATVKSRGYVPQDTSEYHAGQTLRVLVGTRSGSGDGYGQQAFFFLDGRYLGTDTKEPSAKLKVVAQSDTEVAIAYPLYRRNDPLCCPSGGQRVVHFSLDSGKLQALDPIPPANGYANLSRY